MPAPSMATISCCHQLRPPSPATAREGAGVAAAGHLPMLRRACLAAACVVAVGATGTVDGAAMATSWGTAPGSGAPHGPHEAAVVRVQAPSRWSDRRQCPPWRANSLENVMPENLPRPAPRRRFNGVASADRARAPAPAASPDAVVPLLALRSGSMGCFSL